MNINWVKSPDNKENLNLNKLKPVSEYQKQVVFQIEEKLDAKLEEFFDFNFKDYLDEGNNKDKIEAINKYKILSKYFDIYSIMEEKGFNLTYFDEKLKKYFRIGHNVNEKIIDFLHKKLIFDSLEGFLILNIKSIFINENVDIFIKKYNYLENFLGRNLTKEDFKSSNFIDFLQKGNIQNLEFLLREIKKEFHISDYKIFNDVFFEEKNISERVGNKEIDGNLIVNFCLQKGLSEKLEYFSDKKGENFNVVNFFENDFEKKSGSYIPKSTENFKKSTNIIFDKYQNLESNRNIFYLLDNIGKNIFLFEKFNISYDYFKNMKIGTEDENIKFIYFLVNSQTQALEILIEKIPNIKLKDLFNIYKMNSNILENSFTYQYTNLKFLYGNDYIDNFLYFFKYSIEKNNYYFLSQNTTIFEKSIEEKSIVEKTGEIERIDNFKIKKLLDKTGGFITQNLFKSYVLVEDSDLDEIWSKYENAMKKVLSNEQIKKEELDDFLYEAIFMAYRPTGFSENDIKEMIENGKISDLTHQLENISFDKEGYDLVLSKNEKRLEGEIDTKLLYNSKRIVSGIKVKEFMDDDFIDKINLNTFFSKSTEFKKIEKIITKFYSINNDPRLNYIKEYSLGEDFDKGEKAYKLLNNLYEIFGVVTKDSFPEYLKVELEKLEKNKIEDIFEKMGKLKDPRFKKEFEEVSKNIISDENNILSEEKIEVIALLTEKRIIEFGSFMRKKIKKELKKFNLMRGEEKHFKAIISKNIGSFFAKAGAELCTSNDTEMWKEERHIHLNLIDEEKNQIVGNIMLYFEEDRDYLVVRGFNPIKEIEANYDKKTTVDEMIRVVKQIAKENGFEKVYIPKVKWSWHNLSNRDGVQKLVWNHSLKNINEENYLIENAEFYDTQIGTNKVDELYLL